MAIAHEFVELPRPYATRRLALLAFALVACAIAVLPFDVVVARWFLDRPRLGDVRKLVQLSEAFAHGSGVLLILLGVMAVDPRHWRVLPRLALGAYGAGLTADLLKIVLARTRPNQFDVSLTVWDSFLGFFVWTKAESLQEALHHGIQSFPSGHAATAAGLACGLARLYPRASWFFVAMTAIACFQRVEAGAHYVSDVLVGAAVGVVFNLLLDLPKLRRRWEQLEKAH